MPAHLESVGRIFDPPRGSFFLFGPRGTGKATRVKARFALYRGKERLRFGPIRCLPCSDFLTQLHPRSPLSGTV